jgi:hypothetical protein
VASTTVQRKRSGGLAGAAVAAILSALAPCAQAGTAHVSASSGGVVAPGGSAPAGGATPSKKSAPGKSKPSKAPPKHTSGAGAVTITGARCVPAIHCGSNLRQVSTHGTLQVSGEGLASGMVLAFPRSAGARIASGSPYSHLHRSPLGLVATVPASAHSGRIQLLLGHGRRSNSFGPVYVVRHALHPPAPAPPKPPPKPPATASVPATTPVGSAFDGQGMWIWYISDSEKGNVASIIARAHAADVTTVFIKSSDGSTNYWSQFSSQLVEELRAGGLKVCAWQYVYGTNPTGEADLGIRAVKTGAECLVIDAEAEYEGHYGAAQTYIKTLRAAVGPVYPIGLASFPYVDYHEAFPYSVFLGPEGAQFNAPQMYWKDIGTSVANVFGHTYEENLIYGRLVAPLGQTYGGPSTTELVDFRSLAHAYGAGGLSFWDWQETTSTGWTALAQPLNESLTVPSPELTSPLLGKGARGDQVLWMQEHLASAIEGQPTNGVLEGQTVSDLERFQAEKGLPATGETDASTWGALLALPPVAVNWGGSAKPSG